MAEFQWWLLIVGLVAGGALVAVVTMDARRREEDVGELERRAEATWIAERLSRPEREIDPAAVESVLAAHRAYLSLPPPDQLVVRGADGSVVDAEPRRANVPARIDELDRDPDQAADEVRDDRRRSADEDLART
jgi:hypothetical protein